MIQKTFVGRSKELDQIRNWLKDSPSRLVLLSGPGGIGKTSLLSRLEKEYSAREDFVVEYFDLSEQPLTVLNQALHLADCLGRENFPQFTQKLTTLESDIADSSALEEDALNAFFAETAFYLDSRKKKLLRIIDTFEIVLKYSLYGDDWAKGVNERLKEIPGVFFLIAGRDSFEEKNVLAQVTPPLEKTFGKENILALPLSGFDADETGDFFAECDPHHTIPDEMREKLQLLTGGKPILLSLAVEWLQKKIPLPSLTDQTLDDLNALLSNGEKRDELLEDFEFELVSRIRQLETPFDIASLYMAHIDRRMDARLLSILLGMEAEEAERNLEEIAKFSFVKEFVGVKPKKCVLHDEMNRLVKAHAWQYLDISGAEREGLTRKAIEKYYQPRIEEFRKQKQNLLHDTQSTLLRDVEARKDDLERWLLEAETLYYHIKLSKEEGYRYFDRLYYDRETSPVRDHILIDEFKRAGIYDEDKMSIRRADALARRGQKEDAKRLCLKVLENAGLDEADRMHVYNTLGHLELNTSPKTAEQNFEQALSIAQSLKDFRSQALIYNNMGRLFRNVSRLDRSIQCFQLAREMVRRSGDLDLAWTINNNLAWTQRLNGDLDDAETLCGLSIAENRKRGLERPLAYAYLTKADIDRDRGDLRDAEQYAGQALDILKKVKDHEGIIQIYRTLANISRSNHNYEQAFRYFEDGIRLAQESKSFLLLASLHQLLGRSYRHYAEYLEQKMAGDPKGYQSQRKKLLKEALNSLNESLKIARQIQHPWEVARSELEIIHILLMQETVDDGSLIERLDEVWNIAVEVDDDYLKGYVYENYARIEMKNERYLEAGHAFGQAAYFIAQRPGVETGRAFDRLRNAILDSRLREEQTNALAQGTREEILEKADYQKYSKLTSLVNMCEHILGLPITAGGNLP